MISGGLEEIYNALIRTEPRAIIWVEELVKIRKHYKGVVARMTVHVQRAGVAGQGLRNCFAYSSDSTLIIATTMLVSSNFIMSIQQPLGLSA